MIVEDDRVVRILLEHIISRDPRLEVAASAGSGEEALRMLPDIKPDVISLDIRLPGMNGFDVTRAVMSSTPTPIVVVSASVEAADLKISMNALRAGALTVVEKPVGVTSADYDKLADRLCRNLALMSDVRLVRQRAIRPPIRTQKAEPAQKPRNPQGHRGFQVLGMVASTGGPNAIVEILKCLGPGFPLPIALVQHITASFLEGFVHWLSEVTGLETRIVSEPQVLLPGVIFVAPNDRHIEIIGNRARAADGPKISGQRPSGTVLFKSMADQLGDRGLGVLLTGMGDDGADGLLALRRAGGRTITEDESTAVVYGMPKVAVALDAADEVLPLPSIGPRIRQMTDALRLVS